MGGSQLELVEKNLFSGDKYKNEINPRVCLRMMRENCKTLLRVILHFYGESWEWWIIIDKDTRLNSTWEVFENLF
jgi:hypothetical protein